MPVQRQGDVSDETQSASGSGLRPMKPFFNAKSAAMSELGCLDALIPHGSTEKKRIISGEKCEMAIILAMTVVGFLEQVVTVMSSLSKVLSLSVSQTHKEVAQSSKTATRTQNFDVSA